MTTTLEPILDIDFTSEAACEYQDCNQAPEVAVQIWCSCIYCWCMPHRLGRQLECDQFASDNSTIEVGWECTKCGACTRKKTWAETVLREWLI